jgi:hypothetical protein
MGHIRGDKSKGNHQQDQQRGDPMQKAGEAAISIKSVASGHSGT